MNDVLDERDQPGDGMDEKDEMAMDDDRDYTAAAQGSVESAHPHEDQWGDTVDDEGNIIEDVQERIEDAIEAIAHKF